MLNLSSFFKSSNRKEETLNIPKDQSHIETSNHENHVRRTLSAKCDIILNLTRNIEEKGNDISITPKEFVEAYTSFSEEVNKIIDEIFAVIDKETENSQNIFYLKDLNLILRNINLNCRRINLIGRKRILFNVAHNLL